MKTLNTLPIENFLDKARIAQKSNQKTLVLPIEEVKQLNDSLAVVMTRLAGKLDEVIQNSANSEPVVEVRMDGGSL